MKKFDIQFIPENSQIRCLAHVVNLVVQKLLAALDEAEDPEVEDTYIPNKDLPFHYDLADDGDLNELEREVFTEEDGNGNEEEDAAELLSGLAAEFQNMSPLQKVNALVNLRRFLTRLQLRTTATKICSSPQRRKRFRATAEKAFGDQLAPSGRKRATLMVVRDVRHRWNYTQAMIERALRCEFLPSFDHRHLNSRRQSTIGFWSDRNSDRFSSNLRTGHCSQPLTVSSRFGLIIYNLS
jgi:hypothetical protein